MSKDDKEKEKQADPQQDDSILTEFDEETGEWEVVGHEDEKRLEAESDAMLRRLEINSPKKQSPDAG